MSLEHRSHPGFGNGPPRYPGTFLLAFREAVAELGWQIRRWLGTAVECVDAEGREQVVGLENLFRRARRQERTDWPELIAEFLRTGQEAPIDDPPADLAEVADQLLVRVGPPLPRRSDGPEVWSQPIAGTNLYINLVIDFPQSMFYVTEALLAASNEPGADWLTRALANLQARTPADSFAMLHEESGLRQSRVGDAYDSSRALLLDALLPEHRTWGFLVALPGRDELLVMPVTGAALQFLPMLKVVAEKNYQSAPYPISDDVFWIHQEQWRVFGITVQNNEATIEPPPEFLPLLAELMPETQQGPDVPEEPQP
jgi:hypothetical protein